MSKIRDFLLRTRGNKQLHISDILSYTYLALGVIIMFGPVIWLILSSFKSSGEVVKFPPRLFPYKQDTAAVEGYEEPLPLYTVQLEDGTSAVLAQVRRVGLEAQMVDPESPEEIIKINIEDRVPVESIYFGLEGSSSNFWRR